MPTFYLSFTLTSISRIRRKTAKSHKESLSQRARGRARLRARAWVRGRLSPQDFTRNPTLEAETVQPSPGQPGLFAAPAKRLAARIAHRRGLGDRLAHPAHLEPRDRKSTRLNSSPTDIFRM